jgi:hypothetical protein
MQKNLPTVSPTRWNLTSRLSITVKKYRYQLCEYLKNTTDGAEIWGTESVIKAFGFLVFRKDFEIIFLLEVFSDVFSFTDVLFNLLQTKEFTSCTEKIKLKGTQFHLNHEIGPSYLWACAVITEKSG